MTLMKNSTSSRKSSPTTVEKKKGFDLYFAGSQNKRAEDYLRANGCNRLCSQLIDRNIVKNWIASRDEGKAQGHLFIDSGAYSAHTRNAEVNVDEYIDYLNSIDDQVYIYAQVDKIPGVFRQPKTKEQLLEAPKESWDNYLYMRDKMKSPDKLLPIFHQGEDFKWLVNMLEWTDENGKHIPYIGISPANDKTVPEKEVFIDKCFKIIANSSNPNVRTHAFGMTSLRLLEAYPFTSADSTTWIMTGATGSILTKYGTVTVSMGRTTDPNHIFKMPIAAQQEIQKYVESHGYDIKALSEDYKERIEFNIMFLKEWADNYQYKPSKIKRRTLF